MTERQFETHRETVKNEDIRKGDVLVVNGSARIAETVKVGTKWVEVRDQNGKLIDRDERGTVLAIRRKYETEASKEARKRQLKNEQYEYDLQRWEPEAPGAAQKVAESIENYGYANWSVLTRLVGAQANDKLWNEWKEAHRYYTEDQGLDTVDAMEAYRAKKTEELVRHARGGQSTSAISNVLVDADAAAIARFVDGL